MTALEFRLMQGLKSLPPERVSEVLDFVEFLAERVKREAATQRMTEAFTELRKLNLPPISDDEINAEIQAIRRERRQLHQSGSDIR